MTYGNGLAETRAYHARQPTEMRSHDPSNRQDTFKLTYGFDYGTANNGNVKQIANRRNTDRTQNFTYDELNRLKTMSSTGTWTGLEWV